MSNYYLTSGNNLELYFHYPEGMQNSGNLHIYGYNNARMEDFPFAEIKIENFDLKQCHPSIYGSYCLKTGINYSGNSWWFAWVNSDNTSDFLKGKNEKDIKNHNILVNLSDPAGMAYGQIGNTGININPSSTNKIFFSLQEFIQGFPQFGWDGSKRQNRDLYNVNISRVTSLGQPVIISKYLRRNFFCAQDLILQTQYVKVKELPWGIGLKRDGTAGPGYKVIIRLYDNIFTSYIKNNFDFAGTSLYTASGQWIDGYRSNDPLYSPIKPPAHPTGWKNLGEN
jgi:sporulation protein YlmC with PRC-barrel domain